MLSSTSLNEVQKIKTKLKCWAGLEFESKKNAFSVSNFSLFDQIGQG